MLHSHHSAPKRKKIEKPALLSAHHNGVPMNQKFLVHGDKILAKCCCTPTTQHQKGRRWKKEEEVVLVAAHNENHGGRSSICSTGGGVCDLLVAPTLQRPPSKAPLSRSPATYQRLHSFLPTYLPLLLLVPTSWRLTAGIDYGEEVLYPSAKSFSSSQRSYETMG